MAAKGNGRCGRRPVFGLADIALAMELKEAGLSYAQIASKWDSGKRMSVSTAYYLCNVRGESGRKRIGNTVKERVKELRKAGLVYHEITRNIKQEFGISMDISTACRICNPRRKA